MGRNTGKENSRFIGIPVWSKKSLLKRDAWKDGGEMMLKIDFESEEAFYIQLRNQIILGIATEQFREGDSLPSVRQLADHIGINMHTVNKAYSVLKQEGFIKLDRRRGAVIALDMDKIQAIEQLREELAGTIARCICKQVTRQEVHDLVDELYDYFSQSCRNHMEE